MMSAIIVLCAFFALVTSKLCDPSFDDHVKLTVSLNKRLLHSVEDTTTLPNPSIHLALRLSPHHNLVQESNYLTRLNTEFHKDLESSLANGKTVTGLLSLYTLALKASCYDLSTVTFGQDSLIHHLKLQMELEKENFATSHRPRTNYYQYSLGVLAECVSGLRVSVHVRNKLLRAVEHGHIKQPDNTDCIDSLAMAGMALQCLKNSAPNHSDTQFDEALKTIKEKLLASRRPDGHMGNEFSTGLALQALLTMDAQENECSASMTALRNSIRNGIYHNPMAISQVLPALQQSSYLQVMQQQCTEEDDSLVLEANTPIVVLPDISDMVSLQVEVVVSEGESALNTVDVVKGSTLLEALKHMQKKHADFQFEVESSLWGPFLSVVNGVKARQSDRSYWHLSSDGHSLTEGIGDYKVEHSQKITIKKSSY